MWICLNDAFLSIVKDPDNENNLVVRARKKEHLEAIFPGVEIVQLKNRDYKYRVFVDRLDVVKVVANRILNLDYGNFKDSVDDNDLYGAYTDVWGIMYGIQDDRKFYYHNFRTSKGSKRK